MASMPCMVLPQAGQRSLGRKGIHKVYLLRGAVTSGYMKQVTAAVLEKGGRILLARRKPGAALAGKWEFPGGKLEPGETPQVCLRRELAEEFGVDTEIGAFVCSSVFEYKHAKIELLVYRARHVAGDFKPVDHDQLAWVTLADLDKYDLSSADIPVIAALRAAGC